MIMAYGQISKVKLDKTEPNIRLNNVKFKMFFFLHIEFNRLSIFILIFFYFSGLFVYLICICKNSSESLTLCKKKTVLL